MAKKRGNRNFRAIRVTQNMNLGALAAGTVVIQNLFDNTDQEMRVISADLTWTLANGEADEGPISVGLAHGDYSLTEIDEWFESTAGIAGDEIALERARRKCRHVGDIVGRDTDGGGGVGNAFGQLKGGQKIRTKMGWHIPENVDISIWARNTGDGALSSTTTDISVSGTVYLVLA